MSQKSNPQVAGNKVSQAYMSKRHRIAKRSHKKLMTQINTTQEFGQHNEYGKEVTLTAKIEGGEEPLYCTQTLDY